jgi:hypothetical protein
MADLDALLADLDDDVPKKPSASSSSAKPASSSSSSSKTTSTAVSKTTVAPKAAVKAKGDYSDDDLSDSGDVPKKKAPVKKKYESSSSGDDTNAPPVNLDELEDLIADIESQASGRLRAPRTAGLRTYGARKTTTRKQVKGALDGDDLDRILEEISDSARKKVAGNTETLGFGVINAERKFDLRAPKAAPCNAMVECTLFVYTQTGEKTRVPQKHIEVKLVGMPGLKHELIDQKDGSWTLRFRPDREGRVVLQIDGYGKRQFDWPIDISEPVAAKECTVLPNEPIKANTQCTATITARDSRARQLRIGGAKFDLAFSGAGQLSQVGLFDRMDGTYTLAFVPDTAGQYAIFITLEGVEIKTHPFIINVSK